MDERRAAPIQSFISTVQTGASPTAASLGILLHGHHRCASQPITTLSWTQCIRPILEPNNRNALPRWTCQGLKAEALSVPAAACSSSCLEWLEGGVGFCLTRSSLHCNFSAEYSHFASSLFSLQLSWRTGPEFACSTLLVAGINLTHIIIALES